MERLNLKVFRVVRGLSQEAMAEKLGISRTFYNSIEQGKQNTSFKFLKKMQETFNLSDDEVWRLSKQSGVEQR